MIRKWYYILAFINLIFSIYACLITNDITPLLIINGGYHMMYWFFGYGPRYQLKFIGTDNLIYKLAFYVIRFFSIAFSAIGLIFIIFTIYSSISSSELVMLFSVLQPAGILLGGLSLFSYLKKIKRLPHPTSS